MNILCKWKEKRPSQKAKWLKITMDWTKKKEEEKAEAEMIGEKC